MLENVAETIPYTPENINYQLTLGKSREELARNFGHKNYKTLDIFMRRKGYSWNRDKQVYELKGIKAVEEAEDVSPGTKKVRQILKLFEEEKDPRDVAKEVGFKNHLVLAEYMQEKGYTWNHKSQRYEPQVGEVSQKTEEKADKPTGNEEEMMQLLLQNKDKLQEMLNNNGESLPRYSMSGVRIAKTLHIAYKLNELIKQFAEDKDITQREFFELAAMELMKKYGYEAEVKGLLE